MRAFPRLRTARPLLAGSVAALASFAVACGGDSGSTLELSDTAAEGRQLANSRGCAGCHGSDGQGGVGPAFVGLFGSQVELEDGSTVTADEAYLTESIRDPGAKLVAGYSLRMPNVDLDDDEIAAIVQYITELAGEPAP